MGYVLPHIYIITGDRKYLNDFHKQQKRDVIGIAVSGIISFMVILSGLIYCLLNI